jgi:hypothetical protein
MGPSLADALLPAHPYTTALKEFGVKPGEITTPLETSPNLESAAKIAATRKAVEKGAAEEVPSGQSIPTAKSPYATQNRAAKAFGEGKPGPFNAVSSSPNIPTPGEIPPFPGEETGAPTSGGGIRPSPSERDVTNVVRKRIVTPEEAALESRELSEAAKRPGEGLMDREARLLGMARARRAAKTMKEPQ